jgi:arylsulfatase A-like enzyme
VHVLALALLGCQAEGPRPDVLLVVVDTLRPDFLGAYGFPRPTSPHLDALAAEGVVFERALAASATTVPSHASLMTSLWVTEHSVGYLNGPTRLDDEVTLARRFQLAGYDTAAFIGNILLRRRTGLDAGFDVYDDELPDVERNRSDFFERSADQTTDRALAWLGERNERPYFLWVHYQDPHGPYTPPAPFDRAFDCLGKEGDEPLPVLENHSGRRGIPAYQALPGLREPGAYRSLYAGEIAFFDASLGRLLGAARERDRPLIVAFTSDHGESMGEHNYWFAHGHATTPDIAHVPLVLVAPGVAPGRRKDLVHHVDVMPTLLDLAGLPVGDVRGLALGRFLRDGTPIPARTLFTDAGGDFSAYRGDGFARFWRQGESFEAGSFAWNPGEGWTRQRPAQALLEELRTHVSRRKALRILPLETDEEERERLRALGYLGD